MKHAERLARYNEARSPWVGPWSKMNTCNRAFRRREFPDGSDVAMVAEQSWRSPEERWNAWCFGATHAFLPTEQEARDWCDRNLLDRGHHLVNE